MEAKYQMVEGMNPLETKMGPFGVSGSFGSYIPPRGRLVGKGKSRGRGSGLLEDWGWDPLRVPSI
jgi:hypothetical protein